MKLGKYVVKPVNNCAFRVQVVNQHNRCWASVYSSKSKDLANLWLLFHKVFYRSLQMRVVYK